MTQLIKNGINLIFALLLPLILYCQAPPTEENPYNLPFNTSKTEVLKLKSKYLHSKFYYQITTPKNVLINTPIIIVLDGAANFHFVRGTTNFLTDIEGSTTIESSIIVGIGSLQRPNDYLFENSENFRKCLYLELIPIIRKTFKCDGPIILIGHSNSADFIVNSCDSEFAEEKKVKAHILASPIFDAITSQKSIIQSGQNTQSQKEIKCQKYVDFVKTNKIYVTSFSSLEDNKARLTAQKMLDSLFENCSNYYSEIFESGNHNILYMSAIPKGLIQVFNNWKIIDQATINNILKSENIQMVVSILDSLHEKKLKEDSFLFYLDLEQLLFLHEELSLRFNAQEIIIFLNWERKALTEYIKNDYNFGDYGFLCYIIGNEYEQQDNILEATNFYELGWKFINKSKSTGNKKDFYDILIQTKSKLK